MPMTSFLLLRMVVNMGAQYIFLNAFVIFPIPIHYPPLTGHILPTLWRIHFPKVPIFGYARNFGIVPILSYF
jgi:hypothetical protein